MLNLNARIIGTIFCLYSLVQSATAEWLASPTLPKTGSDNQHWYSAPQTPPQPLENNATLYLIGYKIESLRSASYSNSQKELIAEDLLRTIHKFSFELASNEQKAFIEAAQAILQHVPSPQKERAEEWLIKLMDMRTTPDLAIDKRLAIASFLAEFGAPENLTYVRYALKSIDGVVLKNYKDQRLDDVATQDLLNWSQLIALKIQ